MKTISKSSGLASMPNAKTKAKLSKTNRHTRSDQSAAQQAVRWVGIGISSFDLSTHHQYMKGFGL